MKTSAGISALATALSKAQSVFTPPSRNAEGQARGGRYKYANLSVVLQSVIAVLTDNELSIVQAPVINGEGFALETRLMHSSGEWIEASYPLPSNVSSQEMGSAITYGRRYSLSAILGIASEDDDDGAGATTPSRGKDAAQTPQDEVSTVVEFINRAMKTFGYKSREAICVALGVEKPVNILEKYETFDKAGAYLESLQGNN